MSEIRATTISDAAGTGPITLTGQSGLKAWAAGTGYTVAIDDSLNISSITDLGTGRYQFNFNNNMGSAAGYLSTGSAGMSSTFTTAYRTSSCPREVKTASACDVSTATGSGSGSDAGRINISIAGDLA